MTPTPQYCQFIFRGLRSGMSYNIDGYVSDVAAALVKWDGGAGAGAASPDNWTPPEAVSLVDFTMVTGAADTTKLQITRNQVPVGAILRYTIHLTSLALRPRLNIPFLRGQKVGAIQLA